MLPGVGGTGLTIAGIRAEETARPDRLFADPLAGAFVAAAGSPPGQPTGPRAAALRHWVVARTVFLDELLTGACAAGARQVVLLGAGFDTRAFRLGWPPGVRYFELDTPEVLAVKAQVLAGQAAVPGCERVPVPCDLRGDWPGALRAAGLRPGRPAAWVAEGLLVYLSPPDVSRLLDGVTSLSAPGSRLGLTFRAREPGDQSAPAVALRRSAVPDDPAGWLAGRGWAAQVTGPRKVLAAHGRQVPARPAGQAGRPHRALLISAVRGRARRRARPRPAAAAAPAPAGQTAADHPLPTLLSQALVAFTIEFDNEAEQQVPHRTTWGPAAGQPGPWLVSQVMWANFLRFVPPDGAPFREVAALAPLVNLAGLQRWGYVTLGPDPAGSRPGPPRPDWRLAPTAAGRRAQQVWGPVAGGIEQRWQHRFGAARTGALRRALHAVVSGLGPGLPPYLPVTGVDKYPGTPPWPAGFPDPGPPDLSMLLARALLAFAREAERDAPLSMAVGANVLRVLGPAGTQLRELPGQAGVAREAVSVSLGLLERGGYAVTGPDPAARRGRQARLTPRGQRAQQEHHRVVSEVTARWADRCGAGQIAELTAALRGLFAHPAGQPAPMSAGLVPHPGGWRASPPYLSQTEARISDPAAALPHYPMVSHRGGYPDGS